jgi:hypothetical protein
MSDVAETMPMEGIVIEFVDKSDERLREETCCVGNHAFTKGAPRRPEIRIDGVLMCESHYYQINKFGLEHFKQPGSADLLRQDVIERNRRINAEKERQQKIARARGNQPGFVYYIRMDDLIKIGYARDISRRMRAYPPSAELLAAHPGTEKLEREIHQDFEAFLRRGREWFAPHETLMRRVAEVRSAFGDPSSMAYKYREAQ